MYKQAFECRVCGNTDLVEVLDLGAQVLTGVFPKTPAEPVPAAPLSLVKCVGEQSCGLLQLQHTYDLTQMYGANYGYRSGLNPAMVRHLQRKVERIRQRMPLPPGSVVIDIGSNDSTTLRAYPENGLRLLGIDPTGAKFRDYYPPHVDLLADFFSAAGARSYLGAQRASVVTSFSMFYDLERPLQFMTEVAEILDEQGVWVFEQSYMPTMLDRNSYDTVCHEHLEYYALKQIVWMAARAGLKVIDVEFNDVNGGSFSVTAARQNSRHTVAAHVAAVLADEQRRGLDGLECYRQFAARVAQSRRTLTEFLETARREGKRTCALGASTKGNVILQYCGVSRAQVAAVAEVNADKYGCYTPGSLLPILPQQQVLDDDPDYLLVLPWHFRDFFLSSPALSGRRLVFPLPALEVVTT